ncbi:hypothetical protein PAMP_000800 [Pampus punctatissimus]
MRVKAISLSSLAEPPPPPIILLTFGATRLVRHGRRSGASAQCFASLALLPEEVQGSGNHEHPTAPHPFSARNC